MSNTENRSLDLVAFWGLLTLFPGFVVYNYMVASNWIPPFLGGLFGGASLVLSVMCLLPLAGYFLRAGAGVSLLEWAFLFLVLYLLLWTMAATVAGIDKMYVEPAVTESVATLSIWLAAFFIGSRANVAGTGSARALALASLLVVAALAHAMWVERSPIGPFLMFHGKTDLGNASSTYQSIGRSILITAIVFAAIQQKFSRQLLVLLAAVAALLATGSRGHLFTCILLVTSLIGLVLLRRRNRVAGLVFVVMLLLVSDTLMRLMMDTRAGEIFDLGESTSWQARLHAQSRALDVLMQNPFVGAFGYHHLGSTGYAHNILSAWTQFGAVAFFAYLGLMLYALFISAQRVVLRERCSALWRLSFLLNMSALTLALASESIFASVFPALGWGFTANALRHEHDSRSTFALAFQAVVRGQAQHLRGLRAR